MMEFHHDIGDKVIALFEGISKRPPERGHGMTFPAVAQVDAYWEGLRQGRPMPARAEVDPRGLEMALEYAFILEQIAPGLGRLRVAGMHLSDLLGMEVRGMPISAFFLPEARNRLSEILRDVAQSPMVADLTLKSDRGIGQSPLCARLFLAPLSTGPDTAPRLLGCLQSEGDIGRTPRRFSIESVQSRRIIATKTEPEPVARQKREAPEPYPGFAEPAPAFAAAPTQKVTGKTKHPHLRLVTSRPDETKA